MDTVDTDIANFFSITNSVYTCGSSAEKELEENKFLY
jgi:hypothetical protein